MDMKTGTPSSALARIGKLTSKRLLSSPGVQKLPVRQLDLFVCPGFLGPMECAAMVGMVDVTSSPSTLFDRPVGNDFRTSDSGNLDRWNPAVMALDARIYRLMGMAERQGETLQGQRYKVGQQFKAHHDFFHTNQSYWEAMKKQGGQRSWTAMIYLNRPEAGGATHFPNAGISVQPRAGLLLMWNNMNADGSPNHDTIHAGLPVQAGTKYIVTKWFREGNWY